jgi:hypothetical protein
MQTQAPRIFPYAIHRVAGWPYDWPDASHALLAEQAFWDAKTVLEAAHARFLQALETEKAQPLLRPEQQKAWATMRRRLQRLSPEENLSDVVFPDALSGGLGAAWAQRQRSLAAWAQAHNLWQAAFEALREQEQLALQQIANQGFMRNALLFCSHSLLLALPTFAAKSPADWDKKDRQLAFSLLRYYLRGCLQATPLGRFATVSAQRWDAAAEPESEESPFAELDKQAVTPNVALLPAFYAVLLQHPAFYEALALRLNPSLLRSATGFDWLHWDTAQQERLQHADAHDLLAEIADFMAHRPGQQAGYGLLKDFLVEKNFTQPEFSHQIISTLTQNGFLEWVLPESGRSASWCGNLYNFLGFLPSSAQLSEAAYLLQWLRTAARTLAFQPIEAALATQQEAVALCRAFFEKYGGAFPDIPAEQVFYQDVAADVPLDVPPDDIASLVEQVLAALPQQARQASELTKRLWHFAQQCLKPDESMPFLDFCRRFLSESPAEQAAGVQVPLPHRVGALLRFFQMPDGAWHAQVVALYPGGGKMAARWLHLFPAQLRETLQAQWPQGVLAFPWQRWYNANFQPPVGNGRLALPDGRAGEGLPLLRLNSLALRHGGSGELFLENMDDGTPVVFSQLGLENPENLPPTMRILWHLGMPALSAADWQPQGPGNWQNGVFVRQRLEYQRLVLKAAQWQVPQQTWADWQEAFPQEPALRFAAFRRRLVSLGLPRFFEARLPGHDPLHLDRDSPLQLQYLERCVQAAAGPFWLLEDLATPHDGAFRVREAAFEAVVR